MSESIVNVSAEVVVDSTTDKTTYTTSSLAEIVADVLTGRDQNQLSKTMHFSLFNCTPSKLHSSYENGNMNQLKSLTYCLVNLKEISYSEGVPCASFIGTFEGDSSLIYDELASVSLALCCGNTSTPKILSIVPFTMEVDGDLKNLIDEIQAGKRVDVDWNIGLFVNQQKGET